MTMHLLLVAYLTAAAVLCIVRAENTSSGNGSGEYNLGENSTVGAPSTIDNDIYILALGPFPDPLERPSFRPSWSRGPDLVEAAALAVTHINAKSDVLAAYDVKVVTADSGCSLSLHAILSFLEYTIYSGKRIVGIIGPACSESTAAIAPLLAVNSLSLLNVATGTSPILADPVFSNTFRVVASALAYVDTFQELMANNTWTRVGTMFEEERAYFKDTHDKFIDRIPHEQVVFTSSIFRGVVDKDTVIHFPEDEIKASQVRVIFVFVSNANAKNIICLAYKRNLLFPVYQWIFHDRGPGIFQSGHVLNYNGDTYNCTKEEMQVATDGVILNNFKLKRDKTDTTELVFGEPIEFYPTLTDAGNTAYSGAYYDATWSLALALDAAAKKGLDLGRYEYGKYSDTELIRAELFNVSFEGITGPILFDQERREAKTIIQVTQFHLSFKNATNVVVNYTLIGAYSGAQLELIEEANAVFIEDSFPRSYNVIHLALSIPVLLCILVVLAITGFMQFVYIYWHNDKNIKATSPNISHLIYAGCYLFIIGAIVYLIQLTFTFPEKMQPVVYATFCNLIMWCLLLGYSLIFGTVCAKVWRVYRIFRHFRNDSLGILITDNALIVFVIFLLIIDLMICLVWTLYDPFITEQREFLHRGSNTIPSVILDSSCNCRYFTQWVAAVTVYKGIVAVVLVVLSFLNRKIRRKEFKHTTQITILVYGITIIGALGFPMFLICRAFRVNLHAGFIIFSVILNTIVVLCAVLLFSPPTMPLFKRSFSSSKYRDMKRRLSTASVRSLFNDTDLCEVDCR